MNGICFLEPHAALATCNLEGRIAVWRMGPAPDPRKDISDLDQDSGAEHHDQGLVPVVQQDTVFHRRGTTLAPPVLQPLVASMIIIFISFSLSVCLSPSPDHV